MCNSLAIGLAEKLDLTIEHASELLERISARDLAIPAFRDPSVAESIGEPDKTGAD